MDERVMWMVGLFIAGLIFNAGGFVWIALNHQRSTDKKIDTLEGKVDELLRWVYEIKGALGMGPGAVKKGR